MIGKKEQAKPSLRDVPERQVRAQFDSKTIRVYQAFSAEIADRAVAAQKFQPPFSRGRMTWIKPSFTWMMYRSGWTRKPGQERVLGVDIMRSGFEWALANSCLSHFDRGLHKTPENWATIMKAASVRIQWDPERTIRLQTLNCRTIQIGLGGEAVDRYVDEWITRIEDLTPLVQLIEAKLQVGDDEQAEGLAPHELPYPVTNEIARNIGALAGSDAAPAGGYIREKEPA